MASSSSGSIACSERARAGRRRANGRWPFARRLPALALILLLLVPACRAPERHFYGLTLPAGTVDASTDGIGSDMRMERLEYDFLGGFVVARLIYHSSRVPPELGLDGVVGDGSPDEGIDFRARLGVLDHPDSCKATPAIADGRLYIRTRGALYCFAKRDQESG